MSPISCEEVSFMQGRCEMKRSDLDVISCKADPAPLLKFNHEARQMKENNKVAQDVQIAHKAVCHKNTVSKKQTNVIFKRQVIFPKQADFIINHEALSSKWSEAIINNEAMSPKQVSVIKHKALSPKQADVILNHEAVSPKETYVILNHEALCSKRANVIMDHEAVPPKWAYVNAHEAVSYKCEHVIVDHEASKRANVIMDHEAVPLKRACVFGHETVSQAEVTINHKAESLKQADIIMDQEIVSSIQANVIELEALSSKQEDIIMVHEVVSSKQANAIIDLQALPPKWTDVIKHQAMSAKRVNVAIDHKPVALKQVDAIDLEVISPKHIDISNEVVTEKQLAQEKQTDIVNQKTVSEKTSLSNEKQKETRVTDKTNQAFIASSLHDILLPISQSEPEMTPLIAYRALLSLIQQQVQFSVQGAVASGITSQQPIATVRNVYVTAEAFPSLASELYWALPDDFKDYVSLSMMEYYLMILYYCRLAELRKKRQFPSIADRTMCAFVGQYHIFVPNVFEDWINMRGDDVTINGQTVRLLLPPRPNETGDFGRLNSATHWRYISDLAPRIFRERIEADMLLTLASGPVEWNLSEEIRPQESNCGFPTRNLIGYHVARRLTRRQITTIHWCSMGVANGKAVFPMDPVAECYQFNWPLMQAVSLRFSRVASQFRIVRCDMFTTKPSSEGITIFGERVVSETEEYSFDRNVTHFEKMANVRVCTSVPADHSLAKHTLIHLPRVYRSDGERPISRSWCAYDFGGYAAVPDDWVATRNNGYKQGTWQIWHTPLMAIEPHNRTAVLRERMRRSLLSRNRRST